MFWFGKIVAALVLPPTGPLLLVFLGLAAMRRWRRTGRGLVIAGSAGLLVLSLPVVAGLLSWAVSDAPALPPEAPVTADAIAILGCGTRVGAPEYGADTLSGMSFDRVRYGAFLARRLRLPVAVAGGSLRGGRSEGDLMRESLEREFGVPVKWVESRSRNTHENARGLRDLLQPQGVRRLLVVVHGVDTRRARRELEAAGFDVTMAPTVVPDPAIESVWDFVPSISGLTGSSLALYEVLGNLKATLVDGLP